MTGAELNEKSAIDMTGVKNSPLKIIEVEFITHPTALETVRLTTATGAAVKEKFATDVSTVIYTNIRDHQ